MLRFLSMLLLGLLASPAAAQQVPNPMAKDGANAELPQARANLGAWPTVDAVKDLGCVGDGVTDNTACITAMAAQAGNPNVYFAPGTYLFNCGVYTFASAPTIVGAGREVTKLKLIPGCTLPTSAAGALFNSTTKTGGGWRDLTIDAAGAIEPGVGAADHGHLLRYTCVSEFLIDNVAMVNVGNHSIAVAARTGGCISKNWAVQNSYFQHVAPNPALLSSAIAMGGITAPADYQNVRIDNNVVVNSNIHLNGTNIHATNNDISGWAFGTAIFQVQHTSKYQVITGNRFHDSATTYDFNTTPSGGIELNGEYGIFANNICYNLGGSCVVMFGSYNLIDGNQSQNVGLAVPQNEKAWGPFQAVSNSGEGVISTGNLIQHNRDLGGVAQLYSYYERDALSVNNVVKNNAFPLPILVRSLTTKVFSDDNDTLISPITTTQSGKVSNTVYTPGGASLSVINELSAQPTLGATSVPVQILRGMVSHPIVSAGFTGTLDSIAGYTAVMGNASAVTVPSYVGFLTGEMSNGNGITSGSVTNTGHDVATPIAAAGSGGNVVNNGLRTTVGSGSSAGTTNRGLHITNNGGTLSTNYAIYSDSTARSLFSGPMTFTAIPTSAGAGGLALCIDTLGVLYKKASCP